MLVQILERRRLVSVFSTSIVSMTNRINCNLHVASLGPLRGLSLGIRSPLFSSQSLLAPLFNAKRAFYTNFTLHDSLHSSEYLDDIDETDKAGKSRFKPAIPIGVVPQDMYQMIQRQQNKNQAKVRSAIRVLPGFKQNRLTQASMKTTADQQKLSHLEKAISISYSRICNLVHRYCDLKFSYVTEDVSLAAEGTRSLRLEYCKIAAEIIQQRRSELFRRDFDALKRLINVLEELEGLNCVRLAEIDRLQSDLFAPRLSARSRVDANLKAIYALMNVHEYLHILVSAVTENSLLLQRQLRLLAEASPQDASWKVHLITFSEGHRKILKAAHIYRSIVNIRRVSQSQFADAWPFKFFLSPNEERVYSSELSARISKLPDINRNPSTHGPVNNSPLDNDIDPLEDFYFSPSWSRRYDIWHLHRRQLDAMAPFVAVDRGAAVIIKQAHALFHGIGKEMWRNLEEEDIKRHKDRFDISRFQFAERRVQFKVESIVIWYMNWIRLKAEDRLHTLYGPGVKLGSELTISKPISQSLSKFRKWLHHIRVDEKRVMPPLRTSANVPNNSLEPEDVEDGDEDARELIGTPLFSSLGSSQSEQEAAAAEPCAQPQRDPQAACISDKVPRLTCRRHRSVRFPSHTEKGDLRSPAQGPEDDSAKQHESQGIREVPKEHARRQRETRHPSMSKARAKKSCLWPRWPGITGAKTPPPTQKSDARLFTQKSQSYPARRPRAR